MKIPGWFVGRPRNRIGLCRRERQRESRKVGSHKERKGEMVQKKRRGGEKRSGLKGFMIITTRLNSAGSLEKKRKGKKKKTKTKTKTKTKAAGEGGKVDAAKFFGAR